MQQLAQSTGLELTVNEYVNKQVENRKQEKVMDRIWLQATFRNPMSVEKQE
jgi:hypothetical protein